VGAAAVAVVGVAGRGEVHLCAQQHGRGGTGGTGASTHSHPRSEVRGRAAPGQRGSGAAGQRACNCCCCFASAGVLSAAEGMADSQCPGSRGRSSGRRTDQCRRGRSSHPRRARRAGGPGRRPWSGGAWRRTARRRGRCASPSPSHLHPSTHGSTRRAASGSASGRARPPRCRRTAAAAAAPHAGAHGRRVRAPGPGRPGRDAAKQAAQRRRGGTRAAERPTKRPLVSKARPANIVMSRVANTMVRAAFASESISVEADSGSKSSVTN